MTNITESEKARIRNFLPVYLEQYKAINPRKAFRCLNPAHEDRNPSMSYDSKRQICHCFSCQKNYDLFDLIGMDYSLPEFPAQYAKALELFPGNGTAPAQAYQSEQKPKQPKDYSEYLKRCALQFDGSPAEQYLRSRGISPETAVHFTIGYDPAFRSSTGEEWQAVIIPTGHNMKSFTARNISETGKRYENRGTAALFNPRAIRDKVKSPLFITEGEIDALSIAEAGADAVGLGSASNVSKLTEKLKEVYPERLLILALDNDEAGRKATEALKQACIQQRINHEVFNPYGAQKDANAALTAEKEIFMNRIRNAVQLIQAQKEHEYRTDSSALGMIPAFIGSIHDSQNSRPISTGFQNFDKALDGGLYKGLYVLGAISSLGKTTFCLQIADQIALSGRDVMIFSLEMSADELIAKSISRNTLQLAMKETGRRDYAKTMRGIMDGSRYKGYGDNEKKRIAQALAEYKKIADHVFIRAAVGRIGVPEIKEEVMKHKQLTGRYPIIIIDYLQILKADDPHMTDKQNTDNNVTMLKQLAREMPVIAISSMNRDSYKTGSKGLMNNGKVSITDLKESGGIDYGADIVIGLQFTAAGEIDTDENGKKVSAYDERTEKQKDPREITAVILKNRYYSVYNEIKFAFIPQYNYFAEI